MGKAVRSMIRVLGETRSARAHEAAFGLFVADRFSFADVTILDLRNAETDFELEPALSKRRNGTPPPDLRSAS